MQYYVRQLPNGQALLVAEDGYPLSYFDSVNQAVATCILDCRVVPMWIEWYDGVSAQGTGVSVQGVDADCVHYALNQHFRGQVGHTAARPVLYA